MRILTIDIETRPSLAYVWDVWEQNIHPRQLVNEKAVISFAAKWYGEDEVIFFSDHHNSHARVVREAYKLLDQADAVVHYNGKRFDIPHLNREFLEMGLTPPSPFREIDLLLTIKRKFKFTHNKLDHVAAKLLGEKKVEHEGFDLWVKCMAHDPDAWDRMRDYNIGDVLITEKLYTRILPWIDHHPSHATEHADMRCPNCGCTDFRYKGLQRTLTRSYPRYKCKGCGRYFRETHNVSSSPITSTSSY